jgi:hypothetical protein
VTAAIKALCVCAALPLVATSGGAWAGNDKGIKVRALKPEADTYVSAARPDTNFGRATILRAAAAPQATTYLRFRHTALSRNVVGVTLVVRAHAGGRTGFEVRRVPHDEWRERTLTYATAPRPSLRYASATPVRQGSWRLVDVTSFVSDGSDTITLAITTRSPHGVAFRSRESKQRPMLVVRSGGHLAEEIGGVDWIEEISN